jgi:hypothetical protein
MSEKYIFISAPYSHPDKDVILSRVDTLVHVVGKYMEQQLVPMCPIIHSHPILEKFDLTSDWSYWEKSCTLFLHGARRMDIIMLDGWKDSTGIKGEIEIAKSMNIPVNFIDHTNLGDLNW